MARAGLDSRVRLGLRWGLQASMPRRLGCNHRRGTVFASPSSPPFALKTSFALSAPLDDKLVKKLHNLCVVGDVVKVHYLLQDNKDTLSPNQVPECVSAHGHDPAVNSCF